VPGGDTALAAVERQNPADTETKITIALILKKIDFILATQLRHQPIDIAKTVRRNGRSRPRAQKMVMLLLLALTIPDRAESYFK
jgi:hypothetical protein